MRYLSDFTTTFIHNKFYFEKYHRGSEGTKSKLKGEALMLFTLTKNPAHKRKARVWTWLSQGWLNSTDPGSGLNWNPKTCLTLFARSKNSFIKTFTRTCNLWTYLFLFKILYCLWSFIYKFISVYLFVWTSFFFSKILRRFAVVFAKLSSFSEKVYNF